MTTLTDRYIWAASRSIPEPQRADFSRELQERLGDTIDGLVAQGRSPDDAERGAISDLGDPAVFAAAWADRPLHLVGPRYFMVWKQLLVTLLWAVVPVSCVAIFLIKLLGGDGVGAAIGSTIGISLSLVVHLAFWVTLLFVVLERTRTEVGVGWTPDDLPTPAQASRAGRRADLVASLVLLAVAVWAVLWQRSNSPYRPDGEAVAILHPDLWSFWMPAFFVLVGLEVVFALVLQRRGWSWPLALANIVLAAAFVVPAAWLLATDRMLNPDFLARSGWPWTFSHEVLTTGIVVVIAVIAALDAGHGIVQSARQSRTAAQQ